MPNTTVPANAGGMPKFNRVAIMADAWRRYRDIRVRYADWQTAHGIVDASFSACLKMAWASAKNVLAAVARKVQMEKVLTGSKGPTIKALLSALDRVQYLSLRYKASEERTSIQRQIDALVSEAA